MDQQKTTKVLHALVIHMALRIISNHVTTMFLVSEKVIVIQQAVSCVGISSPYSCVESDANKKDSDLI